MIGWKRVLIVVTAGILLAAAFGFAASPTQRNNESRIQKPGFLAQSDYKAYTTLQTKALRGEVLSLEEKADLERLSSEFRGRDSRSRSLDNTGGPDEYGYVFMDNQAPDTATFEWIELRGDPQANWVNTWPWQSHDDAVAEDSIPIGFDFPFYGQDYSHFWVCTNGHIQFASQSTQYWDICLPVETMGPSILLFGDDLHLDYGGIPDGMDVIGYRNFGDYFVIEFDSVGHCCMEGTSFKFEAILYNDGRIKLQYHTLVYGNNQNTQTIGIQESATGQYLEYVCDGVGFQPGDSTAIWFFQMPGIPSRVTNLQGLANGTTVTLAWTDPITDTYGDPVTIDSVVLFRDEIRLGSVAPGVQLFTETNVPMGTRTYTVRAYNGLWPSGPERVSVMVGNPSYMESFDITAGDWTTTSGWEWGAPTNQFPHSAPNVWGNRLAGNYQNSACDEVRLSPNLAVNNANAMVEFYCWYQTENVWDGVNFQISVDGGNTWEILTPTVHPYDFETSNNACIGDNPLWSGMSDGWVYVQIPFGTYIGQTPVFRFVFGSDGSVENPGFLFDDMLIWGLATPAGHPVSGTITLDGTSGSVTQVVVRANGPGNPTTNPAANGTYTLNNVQLGQRVITASLINYTQAVLNVNVPAGGLTGQNMTLRRLPPPAPTGLAATQDTSGQFISLDWNNSIDATVDVYNVYRKPRSEATWTLIRTVVESQCNDTLTISNAYQYGITAVDTNVLPPVLESPRSGIVQVIYGSIPPTDLSGSGRYDDRIHLTWIRPGEGEPPAILQYDDNTIERWMQIHSPNGESDYFAVRFETPLSEGGLQYPLPLRYCTIFSESITPLSDIRLCADREGVPDMETPIERWSGMTAVNAPGWIHLPIGDGTVLSEPSAVWLVWQQPAGTDFGIGADQTSSRQHSFFSEDGGRTWDVIPGANLASRMWIGGGDHGSVVPVLPAMGCPPEWIADRVLALPEHLRADLLKGKATGPVASPQRNTGSFAQVISHPVRRNTDEPYVELPGLDYQFSERHASTLDDPNYYIVYRDSIDIAHPTTTTYDNMVAENHNYTFFVTAHYPDGSESGPTNSVTLAANMAPGAPRNLTATPIGTTIMRLNWLDPLLNENGSNCVDMAGVRVYRNGTLIGTAPAGSGRFNDTPPVPNRLYTWSVRAIDEVPNEGPTASIQGSVVQQWMEGSYDWIDIDSLGTPVVACDDCMEGPFDIGFPFTFYGATHDTLWIASNGYISFMDTWSSTGGDSLPSVWDPNNSVYIFWDDLNPASGGVVKYYSDVVNQRFIVSWIGVPHFSIGGSETFQIILEADGSIKFNYQDVDIIDGCTAGVENATGTMGITVWYNGEVPGADFVMSDESAVDFWGDLPLYCDISGNVSFDGGSGVLTQVSVRSNGPGHPTVNPSAVGAYTLHDVVVGNRVLTASLDGYHTDTLRVTIPDTNGLTNQNFVLRRLNPPAPTGLTATINSATGRDSLHWNASTDVLVDYYNVYRKLRDAETWVFNRRVMGRLNTFAIDTLTTDGVYYYAVTAVDSNVIAPAVESDRSARVQVLYGEIPPERLSADGHFDNKIRLTWLPPGTPPPVEVGYDSIDLGDECVWGSAGWWWDVPFGWYVAHFQGRGDIRIERIKTYHVEWVEPGAQVQMGVFADAGNGTPTFTPLGVTDTVISTPGAWLDVELATPVNIPGGSFFIGIRQVTWTFMGLAIDGCSELSDSTFFVIEEEAGPWMAIEEQGYIHGMAIRGVVVGDMGLDRLTELAPAPVRPTVLAANFASIPTSKSTSAKDKSVLQKQPATKSESRTTVMVDGTPVKLSGINSRVELSPYRHIRISPYISAAGERGRNSLDDVVQYRIFRNGVQIGFVAGTVLTYENTGLTENQQFTYDVRAAYDNGQVSGPSNTVTLACNMEPAAPTGLILTPASSTTMRLEWTNPTTNADGTPCTDLTGCRIYRDGEVIGNVAAGVQVYVDTPPEPMMFYEWTVRAIDEVPNVSEGISLRGAVVSPWRVVEYEWVDVWNQSTPVCLTEWSNEGPFDLGFSFLFYGQPYNQIRICSNGFLSFTSTYQWTATDPIPNTWDPNAAIYAFSTYLNTSLGGCRYFADAANERFIVTWQNVPHWEPNNTETFQVILEPDDGIRINYQIVSDPDWCLIGVENESGTEALQLYCQNTGDFTPTSQTSLQFWGGPAGLLFGYVRSFGTPTPIADAQVWAVGAEFNSDTVLTDASGYYELGVDEGVYTLYARHATRCDTHYVNVNVPHNGEIQRDVIMRAPSAQFSHTSVTMSTYYHVNTEQTFTISNNGGQCPLSYAIADTSAWLSVNPASGTIAPNQSVTITVSANVQTMPANSEHHSALVLTFNAIGSPRIMMVDLFVGPDAVDPSSALPTEFAYHQNYPNPFNAATTLTFDVPTESQVRIVIYNLNGQEVATPVVGRWNAGRHKVAFDASDLPSGMYLVRMTAGDFKAVGKMMLIK